MPTYDYECQSCDHRMEAFHSMSADPLKDCPSCGEPALKRLIGPGAGLLFKGSGFYQTDYRSDSYKKSAKADTAETKKESGKKDASSSGSKSDSKPAAKSETKSA